LQCASVTGVALLAHLRPHQERRRVKVPDLMHATLVARPFHAKGWVYEEKVDGWRMLDLKKDAGAPRE